MVRDKVAPRGPQHTMEGSFVTGEHARQVLLVSVSRLSFVNTGCLKHFFGVRLGL